MNRREEIDSQDRQVANVLHRVRRLSAERRYRDRHRRFFIEGVRNFVTAVECGYEIDTIVFSEILLTSVVSRKLLRELRRAGTPTVNISPREFRAISVTERASGIAAIVRQKVRRLVDVDAHAGLCWINLSRIRAPGNLGCLVRTSAAVGGAGFILMGDSIDPYDPAVVRASMGALFSQVLVRANVADLAAWVSDHCLQVIGASPEGAIPFQQAHYRRPTILALGEERSGLDADQRSICNEFVRIPMAANFDSLNVSVAGALLMYETYRSSAPEL